MRIRRQEREGGKADRGWGYENAGVLLQQMGSLGQTMIPVRARFRSVSNATVLTMQSTHRKDRR